MFKNLNKYSKPCTIAVIAIVLLLCSSLVYAKDKYPSPQRDTSEYNLIVYRSKGETGVKTNKKKNVYTITAKERNGYNFTHWVIKGKYIINKGKLTSKNIKITLKSDCEATPYFESVNKNTDNTPIKINKSPVSPKTGDNRNSTSKTIEVLLVVVAFLLGDAVLAIFCGSCYYFIISRKREKK